MSNFVISQINRLVKFDGKQKESQKSNNATDGESVALKDILLNFVAVFDLQALHGS